MMPEEPGRNPLMTDFGLSDTYVGVMNGVILSIAPQAESGRGLCVPGPMCRSVAPWSTGAAQGVWRSVCTKEPLPPSFLQASDVFFLSG